MFYRNILFSNKKLTDSLVILAVLCISMILLFSGYASMKWDIMDISLPWNYYVTEALKNKELPLWNPYANAGFSQMSDPQTWYPVVWFLGLFGKFDIHLIHLEYLLHLYIAALGMYAVSASHAFSRKTALTLAISYMFSGFFISNAQHLGWIVSAAWLPWMLLFFTKLLQNPCLQNSLKLGLVLFLSFTGGYPGLFISSCYLLLFWFILHSILNRNKFQRNTFFKQLLFGGIALLLFALISAPALYASMSVKSLITRGDGLAIDSNAWGILTGSLTPKALLTFILPFLAGYKGYFWETDFSLINLYIGIIPLMAVVFSFFIKQGHRKRTFFYICTAVFFLCIALATTFPLRSWITVLPFMDLFRMPSFFRIFAIFFLLLASGFALDFLWDISWNNQKIRRIFLLASISLLAASILFLLFGDYGNIEKTHSNAMINFTVNSGIAIRIGIQLLVYSLFCGIIFVATYFKKNHYSVIVIFLISVLDIASATGLNMYATVVYDTKSNIADNVFDVLPENPPIPSLKQAVGSYSDEALRKTIPYLWMNLPILHKTPSSLGNSPYCYSTTKKAIQNGTYASLEKQPLFFLTDTLLADNKIDTSRIIPDSDKYIKINTFNNNNFSLSANFPSRCYLVCVQNYHPDWNSYINGTHSDIRIVGDTFMSVDLQAGKNKINFVFEPKGILLFFRIGTIILIISLLILLIINRKNRLITVISGFIAFIVLIRLFSFFYEKPMYDSTIMKYADLYADSLTIIENSNALIFNTGKCSSYFAIDVDLPGQIIQTIIPILDSISSKYVLYVSNGKIRNNLTEFMVRSCFNQNITTDDKGNLFAFLGIKGRNNYYRIIKSDSFKAYHLKDSACAFSKKYSVKMTSAEEYGPEQIFDCKELLHENTICSIGGSVRVKSDSLADAYVALSISREGNSLCWETFSMREYYTPNKWYTVYFVQKIKNLQLRNSDEIKVFIWNPHKHQFWVDDFQVVSF